MTTTKTIPSAAPRDPSWIESSMLIACHQRGGSTYAEWLRAHPEALASSRATGIRGGPDHIWDRLLESGHILVTRERRDRSLVYVVSDDNRELLDLHEEKMLAQECGDPRTVVGARFAMKKAEGA